MRPEFRSKLEQFAYVEPGLITIDKLWRNRKSRSVCMDTIQKTPDGFCAWCNVTEITDRRRKYCNDQCQQSAFFYMYPQTPGAKAWRLIDIQGCACAGCGLDYSQVFYERMERILEYNERQRKNHPTWFVDEKISYFRLGYNTGTLWHVDHIRPMFNGGDGIGMLNLQVLCVPCHKKKTVEERR